MISIGGSIFGNLLATRHECIVIHAEIGKARSAILKELEICDFD